MRNTPLRAGTVSNRNYGLRGLPAVRLPMHSTSFGSAGACRRRSVAGMYVLGEVVAQRTRRSGRPINMGIHRFRDATSHTLRFRPNVGAVASPFFLA